jgi:hypothetical protein
MQANLGIMELFMRYGTKFTPATLNKASSSGSRDGILLMFDLGYDSKTPDSNGWTALYNIHANYYMLGIDQDNWIVAHLEHLIIDPSTRDNWDNWDRLACHG